MHDRPFIRAIRRTAAIALTGVIAAAGCAPQTYDPARATARYPEHLHLHEVTVAGGASSIPVAVDMQVFRRGEFIEIVNATVHGYEDFDLWINKRYVRRVGRLRAGETIRLHLGDFYDCWGESIRSGGFFATESPTPIRLVQIQVDDETPLVGLVTIRPERVDLPRQPRRR